MDLLGAATNNVQKTMARFSRGMDTQLYKNEVDTTFSECLIEGCEIGNSLKKLAEQQIGSVLDCPRP